MVQPVTYGNVSLPLPNLGVAFAEAGTAIGEALRARQQASEADMYKQDLKAAMDSGNPVAFANLAAKYPSQAQSLKASFGLLSAGQQQSELLAGAEAYNAIRSGRPDMAKSLIDNRILAAANAGKDTSRLESIRNSLDADPQLVAKNLDMIMYAIAPDQWSNMTGGGNIQVQSSEILPDGTTVIVTKDGRRVVRDPQGNEVTGTQAQTAIEKAQQKGVSMAVEKTSRADAIRKAGDIGVKAFEQTEKIQTNINNLDDVVKLIDQGANTGKIAELLPDWNSSTIALRNVQNRLGLDVVGSVTFGALSESELALALQTGLPTKLDQAELRQWAINKKNAQQKLLGYLNEQARFLTRGDTTLSDWLKVVDERKKAQEDAIKNAPPKVKSLFNKYVKQGTP